MTSRFMHQDQVDDLALTDGHGQRVRVRVRADRIVVEYTGADDRHKDAELHFFPAHGVVSVVSF